MLTKKRFAPLFATQFLGALNDNLFKNALLVIIVSQVVSLAGNSVNFITNLAVGLFILPYLLFSTTAGQLAGDDGGDPHGGTQCHAYRESKKKLLEN